MTEFNKEYWEVKNDSAIYQKYGCFSPLYDSKDISYFHLSRVVDKLNELENERARLSWKLHTYERMFYNLEEIKKGIEEIESLKDSDVDGVLKLLLTKED